MDKYLREPINTITHGTGAILALIFTGLLFVLTRHWAFWVFGLSMVVCYTASTLHHGVRSSATVEEWLRRLDHSAIYLLIAGTYTPVLWTVLEGQERLWWLVGVWGVALFGVGLKTFTKPPEWLSLVIYLGMGWVAVLLVPQMLRGLPTAALVALVIGGVCYTCGVPFYALGRRVLHRGLWTSHEIWHIFVLAGSASHMVMALNLV
ncbi:MAG: PAQR family membrane homeostasis protein TrhA [Deinococcales bacterium]